MTGEIPEFEIAGVRIHAMRLDDVVPVVGRWIAEGRRDYVVLTGAHGVVEMQGDPELLAINNAAGLTTPTACRWSGWAGGRVPPDREGLCSGHHGSGFRRRRGGRLRSFLDGGKEGVADRLASVVRSRFPGSEIVGTHCPPFRPLTAGEEDALVAEIDASGADIVWVGLGCPKQERWMARFRPRLRASVLIGVGAGFDFLSGEARRAPRWVQLSGFEWVYRLAGEPRRLWPRYSRVVPRFLLLAVRELVRGPRVLPPEGT